MTALPDRDDQVMSLMMTALTLDANERSGYLQTACEGDAELLQEASDALRWEERMAGFLRKPWLSLQELERPFKVGQLINHRFEIVREIGQGGMGVVYEAVDHKRGQRIAIKSAKLGFRRLLSPELESALKVRHPNICLVNEIHTATTDYSDVDFLTMELLEGPTLQVRLSSGGLRPDEALEIARQISAGLAEAHRIGIIHKDLKPANIILSRMADGALRAVITDFGLAGETTAGSSDLAGTPQYMAPELWRGAPASKASDVYALGVILYEMVTGASPFGDEPSEVRLTQRPPTPKSRARNLDKRFDAVISRCLDPSPSARPRDASEVLAAFAPRSPWKWTLAAALALLLLAAGVAVRAPLSKFFEPAHVRLAILPADGDDAIVHGALNDVGDRLASAVVVIRPAQSLAVNARTPEQASRNLHATHALQLASHREGSDLVIQGGVIDLATQTRLQEISVRFAVSSAGGIANALTGAVSKALRLRGGSSEPISASAATPYLQGLPYLRRDQHSFDSAIPLFRRAMQLDPHSPLPRAGLVEALVLKYADRQDRQWITEAGRTLKAAESLNPDSIAVLLAAGRLDTENGRYESALESYRRVAERQPRNVEVWLRIAKTQNGLDRPQEAIQSYQKAIALDPAYYEAYQEFGVFYYRHGEYAKAAEQFRKVIQRARLPNAYSNLGASLNEMGQDDEAIRVFTASLQIKETAQALNNSARSWPIKSGMRRRYRCTSGRWHSSRPALSI